jgi:hypothetical protein
MQLPGVPERIAHAARSSLAAAAGIGGPARTQAKIAFVAGMHDALLAAAGVALLAAIAVALLLRRRSGTDSVQRVQDVS